MKSVKVNITKRENKMFSSPYHQPIDIELQEFDWDRNYLNDRSICLVYENIAYFWVSRRSTHKDSLGINWPDNTNILNGFLKQSWNKDIFIPETNMIYFFDDNDELTPELKMAYLNDLIEASKCNN